MSANPWWVIPEGFAGQLISGLSLQGPALHLYTVKQAATKPSGAVGGPYPTQAAAQAQANTLNQGGTATPGNIASAAASDISAASGTNWGHWLIRIGEALLGLVLIAIGVAHVTKAIPTATKIAKTAGAGALLA